MIPKQPNRPRFAQRFIGGLVLFEAVACGVSYLFYRKLNNSREFRQKTQESAPWVLEMYYKMGEQFNEKNKIIRETDAKVWAGEPQTVTK